MLTTKKLWLKRDKNTHKKWVNLLKANDLNHEELIDYAIGIFDNEKMIGTASTYQNIIKLVAIYKDYQDQNILSQLISELTNYLWNQGFSKVFVYTKPDSEKYFSSLGFQKITQTESIVFM